ncbi:MAG: HAD hydrolase-like protein [Candidatus Sumerlaeia bacterium]|nr:HAD hydrolase-like protein [Candidatus Sumerlaeia bacterium]
MPGQGRLEVGKNGVTALAVNRGGEFVFIARGRHSEIMLQSKVGINPPRFALRPAVVRKPLKGVLLDLDGTCVKSEPLWIAVILQVTNEMRRKSKLPPLPAFPPDDLPHVSGRTVPEHLAYVHMRYFPKGNTHEARAIYDRITRSDAEMEELAAALRRRHKSPYEPADGLRELLLELRARRIGIAMVTSGLYYKAWPELAEAFHKMRLGDPLKFLDALVTAGTKIEKGQAGTMGDAVAKPWPNIYFEPARALGFTTQNAAHFVVVGDSASDVGSARTMGVAVIGVEGGNIREAGVEQLCWKMAKDLHEVGTILRPYY